MNYLETLKNLKEDNNKLIDTSLSFVRYEANNILYDVAKIHLLSAEQAFISAEISNDQATELRVSIGHLRDAYNAYQLFLESKRSYLIFFKRNLSLSNKTVVYLKLSVISAVIAILYKKINDTNSYIGWKSTCYEETNKFITNRSKVIQKWQYARKAVREFWGGSYTYVNDDRLQNLYHEEHKFMADYRSVIMGETPI